MAAKDRMILITSSPPKGVEGKVNKMYSRWQQIVSHTEERSIRSTVPIEALVRKIEGLPNWSTDFKGTGREKGGHMLGTVHVTAPSTRAFGSAQLMLLVLHIPILVASLVFFYHPCHSLFPDDGACIHIGAETSRFLHVTVTCNTSRPH